MRLIRHSMIGLLPLLPPGGAIAQDTDATDRLYRDTTAAIEQRVDVESLLAQCPADLRGSRFVAHRDYHSQCSEDPAACLELCLGGDRPDACFALAVFFSNANSPATAFRKSCSPGPAKPAVPPAAQTGQRA